MTSIRGLVALTALTLSVSFAADIDGRWTAQVQGRNGTRAQTLTLKASDHVLTGSLQGGRLGPIDIANGKIDGNNVSFTIVREFGGNKVTEQFKGTMSGGQLKLTVTGRRNGPIDEIYKKE